MPNTRKASKRAKINAENKLREEHLTADLFGVGTSAPSSFLQQAVTSNENDKTNDADASVESPPDEFSFEIDRVGDEVEEAEAFSDADDGGEQTSSSEQQQHEEAPAWIDQDELKVDLAKSNNRLRKLRKRVKEELVSSTDYESRLRERFQSTTQLTARTDWAAMPEEDTNDASSTTNILTSTDALLASKRPLPSNILNLERCPDLNMDEPNKAVVQAVDFHNGSDPDRPIALTAGLDKTLRFFQVTAEKSEKIHGIHFPKLPIMSASFLGSSGSVVVSGRRSFFYLYDSVAGKLDFIPRLVGRPEKSLERSFASPDGRTVAFCGNDGFVLLFDTHNKAMTKTVKMNGSVRSICFQGDNELLTSGSDGDVYRWDLRSSSRLPLERFSNQDGSITSAMAVSERTLAVGSESGVVNLYSEVKGRSKEPMKSILNIRTPINRVKFNSDGNMLVMSSKMEKDALKIVHIPSGTVFSNWPTSSTPLEYVWSTSFSPESKFLAIGNDKGKCLLYKLQHYHEAD